MNIEWRDVEDFEQLIVKALQPDQHEISDEERSLKRKKELKAKIKKYALIGVATVGGGTLIGIKIIFLPPIIFYVCLGLTGGLAAPLIAGK